MLNAGINVMEQTLLNYITYTLHCSTTLYDRYKILIYMSILQLCPGPSKLRLLFTIWPIKHIFLCLQMHFHYWPKRNWIQFEKTERILPIVSPGPSPRMRRVIENTCFENSVGIFTCSTQAFFVWNMML